MLLWKYFYFILGGEDMRKLPKIAWSLLLTAVLMIGFQVGSFADEEVIDEAEIYLDTQAAITVSANSSNRSAPQGTRTADISNSPAITGGSVESASIGNDDPDLETEVAAVNTPYAANPGTGVASMALPVGTALLSLGCIPVLYKKK